MIREKKKAKGYLTNACPIETAVFEITLCAATKPFFFSPASKLTFSNFNEFLSFQKVNLSTE